jgi:cobalt-zinc-cadmium efflux system membrane fusion protein
MIRLPLTVLALALGFSAASQAQQQLPLNSATEHRLGLVFTRLDAPDQHAGAVVPAQVTSSPLQQSAIVALHGGVLESWAVAPGAAVAAGDLLGLVRSPAVLALQQAWRDARAVDAQAATALQRDQRLFADGVIAESRLLQTQRERQAAQASLDAATAQLATVGFGAAERDALLQSSAQLGFYRITARHAGRVAHLQVLPGEAVSEGAALVELTSDSLWVSAEIPARLAVTLAEGQQLGVERSGASLTLRQRDQGIDSATQTVGILAEFDAPADFLPGQLVNLVLPSIASGVLVPADAVVRNGEQTSVYVRSAGGVESRVLQLQVLGSDYLATSGIAAGEEVVIRGAALLKGIELGLGGE